jgi:hypothetical protein
MVDAVLAGMRAAVLTQESDLRTWFSWPIESRIVDQMVDAGRLLRPSPGWLTLGRG